MRSDRNDRSNDRSHALRVRAEALLERRTDDDAADMAPEVRALVHDLSVHQIELELQNEELRDAQQRIAQARDDYALLYNQAPVGYMTLDANGIILRANETLARMLGAELSAVTGTAFADHLVAADRDVLNVRYKAFFKAPKEKSVEVSVRHGAGEVVRARLTGRREHDTDAAGAQRSDGPLLVVVHDVTEAHRASEALRAEKELLAVTLRSIAEAVISTDLRGRVTLMNPVAEELTGWRFEDARGLALTDVVRACREETREPCPSLFERLTERGEAVKVEGRAVLVARDGGERLIAESGAPIRDGDGQLVGAVQVLRDITSEDKMQREMQRMARLDSLGVMAGGIAHDFNNLLTAIAANMGLARDVLRATPSALADACLADAEVAASRARGLTQQLLTFSKGGAPVRETITLPPIAREAASLALTGSRSRCEIDAPDTLWPVSADKGQVSQVLHNLLLNADQAMPEGGSISLRLSNARIERGASDLVPPGPYVQIVVQDQGHGIAPEIRDKIFDPFFTTKHQGSGLGLASAWSIVRNHDGYIRVESTPGRMSAFSVLLPASPEFAPREDDLAAEPPRPRAWRVLVLDDEPMIARIAQRILASDGHQVTTAAEGSAAIAAWMKARATGKPFDLLILDLTVPGGLGGKEVIAELRSLDPSVRAIASSGYATDPIMANHRDYGFAANLPKPYTIDEMRELVARLQRESAQPSH